MRPFFLSLLTLLSIVSIAEARGRSRDAARGHKSKTEASTSLKGMASWYGKESRRTASGEHYDPSKMTAAHRTLPLGTLVKVTNLGTKCTATVTINDRGPFTKGRIIDVSKAAAQELKMIGSGTARVELEVISLASR